MDRRTLTMNWDNLGEEDDDSHFFETYDRISSVSPIDLANSSDDDEFEDSRLSFASAISSTSIKSDAMRSSNVGTQDYDLWMAEPGSITERRKRLLQGMGFCSNKNLVGISSAKFNRTVTKKIEEPQAPSSSNDPDSPPLSSPGASKQEESPSPSAEIVLVRSRSDGDIVSFSLDTRRRKEEMIGSVSKQRLTRTSSQLSMPLCSGGAQHAMNSVRLLAKNGSKRSAPHGSGTMPTMSSSNSGFSSFFLIKNLDTGKEFIVKEYNDKGMWNKLSDIQTGKQLTMEEFEKSVGHSPVVKELMRREGEHGSGSSEYGRKVPVADSYLIKSFRYSKRRGVALLKNIKGVANSMSVLIGDRERENAAAPVDNNQTAGKNSSQWVKVRHQGKSCKEFSAMHLCQEIQAHQGSIWTIRFSFDARYLASAGEDREINIWEVQESDVMQTKQPDDLCSASAAPVHPITSNMAEKPPLPEINPTSSEKKKKGKSSSKKKGNSIPDYAHVPETVFALSEKPVCTLKGHQDDVLDLSWSRSQLLLSSSMDKTVRLWDTETGSCLKMFAHNDYVTCIQFNPVDDDYFISGSLDAKVRLWNITDRQVVDWTDLHEMVTAACYTPDGQGAVIGSHKGSCRLYSIDDLKLEQKEYLDLQKKKKSQPKKITGFQFCPMNQSDVLVTCADSRIRIVGGTEIIHKFTGFRNTSSQISASFSPDGKYVISASEDSQVYIWKHEEPRNVASGKSKTMGTTHSHEHFPCRDVSVAIPWPGSIKNEPPIVEIHSKRHSKRSTAQPYSSSCSPIGEDVASATSKRYQPPLPKKNNAAEGASGCQEDDYLEQPSRTDSEIGASDSFTSASASIRYGDSPSISSSGNSGSQSWSSSWSWFDGGTSSGANTVQATAWGLVIVTAGLGGEIRVYQNFGLPLKVGRQTTLFRDLR